MIVDLYFVMRINLNNVYLDKEIIVEKLGCADEI